MRQFDERMLVLSDLGLHPTEGDLAKLQRCQRSAWDDRILAETVRSMRTVVRHRTKVMHRVWAYYCARFACIMVALHGLVLW
jgi:hypothetical protein